MDPSILTMSGVYVDLLDPRPSQIQIVDVVHGLAGCGRYANQSPRWISVAEHSWLVAAACAVTYADLSRGDPVAFRLLQLRALLHDASEAYLVDLPAPIKHQPIMAGYREVEARMQAVIFERFGLDPADPMGHDPMVKVIDTAIRTEEMEVLWGPRPTGLTYGVKGLNPAAARIGFQAAFDAIYFADPRGTKDPYLPFTDLDPRIFHDVP